MTLVISNMVPGILVHLSTNIRGNVRYSAQVIEPEHVLENGQTTKAVTETTRLIADKQEHEAAIKVRSKARSLITSVCIATDYSGLLCREDREDDLRKAEAEAHDLVNAFNASATCTKIRLFINCGRLQADTERTARAINQEIRDLLEDMQNGLRDMSPDKIREAAGRATQVGKMLSETAQGKVQDAIEAARKVAREITTEVKKAGNTAALEIDRLTIFKLESARTAFLDLDTPTAEIATPTMAGRAVDFEPEAQAVPAGATYTREQVWLDTAETEVPIPAPIQAARAIELEDTF
jgi:hypothetical protein